MSYKWTTATHRTDNIVDVDSFNVRYNEVKGVLNGDIDRDQIPNHSITTEMIKPKAFYRTAVHPVRLNNDYRMLDAYVDASGRRQFPGVQFKRYAGGKVRSNSFTFETGEGMLHIELSMFLRVVQGDVSTSFSPTSQWWWTVPGMIRYGSMSIKVNGMAVVSDVFKVWQDWNTIHLVGDIPVSEGSQTIDVEWSTRAQGTALDLSTQAITDPDDRCVFYFDGGVMLLLNRYR